MPQNPQLFIYFQCASRADYILEKNLNFFLKTLDFYIVSSVKLILYNYYIINPGGCKWEKINLYLYIFNLFIQLQLLLL